MLGGTFSSLRSTFSPEQTLDLANFYLETARKTADLNIALVLCDDAEASLSQMKRALKNAHTPQTLADQTLRDRIAQTYFERGRVLEHLGQRDKAQNSYRKAQKWGYGGSLSASVVPAASQSTSGTPACAQGASAAPASLPQPASSSAEERGKLVEYLFEKALSTLGSLKGVANKPSLFLVYAHDNLDHGQAEAATSKYLINSLSKVQVKLYSDQTPMGQTYSSAAKDLKEDGKLEDILTNQLCLLPAQLRKDVKPVDKIVVCCSEVLASYLKWADYGPFLQELREAYLKDLAVYRQDREQSGTLAIRQVVRKFSQKPEYKAGFHHVLTEIAFLQIRTEYPEKPHGIIPVSLTANSYDDCLSHFIPATTVRMEDMPRLDAQTKAGEVYLNQSRHGVLFKVIERLLVGSNEAKTFLDQFWKGYSDFISQLKNESTPGVLEFAKRVDGIFNDIQAALHSQLALTVQQQQRFNTDPRAALNEQYFNVFKQDAAFQETLQLYVQPHGKASLHATDTFDLLSKVQALLKEKEVILLTGDSGAGKTTFNRLLEKHLWDTQKEQEAIPLFISLPSIDKPEHDLIAKALKKRGLSEFQIQSLKKEKQKFIFILDGYDEIRQTQNLYLHNRLNQSDGWQGRLVISCRTEYLGENYRSRFQPNPLLQDRDPSFQEIVIAPFSEAERDQYLEKYVQHNPTGWVAHQYKEALEQPHLKALVSNPFLLRVVLEALPYLANEGKARNAVQLRLDLYEQFVKQWFERNQQRLNTQDLTGTKREIFRALCDDDFAEHGLALVQDLAVHLYIENAGNPVIEYSLRKDEGSWKDTFFGNEDKQQLLRDAWPLIRSGNQYRFIHKSLLEYGVARSLFESFDACRIADAHRRRGSDASVYSFENEPVVLPQRLKIVSLAPKHWVGDLGVVRWLTDRVKQDSVFKKQLLAIIEQSKTDKTVREAAANAMTILVRAGVQFNGTDLNHIQIPGADLSFGLFDSAQLQGADLRKVTLRTSWLRQANLSGAQMAGVQFGEWAYVQEESKVTSCAYSPDGKTCAIGLKNGKISLYDTSSWAKIHTLEGHTDIVWSVVYSPSGAQIASGSSDKTVRLWDAHSGAAGHTLEGHTSYVRSVVYSPSGAQIASGSDDTTVRLWDAHSGAAGHTLEGHTSHVMSVVYSPSGAQIASGSLDKTVRLWDAHSGAAGHTLEGHTGWVNSVVYSPSGAQIASGSRDKTVRLWDAHSGAAGHTLEGHTDIVWSVVYSPSGAQIASGSEDNTVRLWDAHSGAAGHTLEGHTDYVRSVVYSPSGAQIASGSEDNTVRLWDAHSSAAGHTLEGHTDRVISVVYSPSGAQIASGSSDKTVRLWDAHSGAAGHTLEGHTHYVRSVAYSPSGAQIASGSDDKTVRLWDAHSGAAGHTLEGHTHYVRSVAYSPSGAQIASGSLDKTVRLWDAHSGAAGHTLEGHTYFVNSVVYSPSGAQIASGSLDKTVRLWDAHSGAAGHTLEGHTNSVWSVVYSPSGAQIASGSLDKTVRLWDAYSGAAGHTLEGHTDYVRSVVYSPSGAQIASGSDDKTVRLWEVASGACLREIQGFRGIVISVAWTELNGRQYLVSGSSDRSVRQWEIQKEPEGTIARLCWSSPRPEVLTVTDTVIEGVQSLSVRNAQLLKQRGSVGEPLSLGELDTSPGTRSTQFTGQSVKPARSANDRNLLSNLA